MIISIISTAWLIYSFQQSVSLKNHFHDQDELWNSHGLSGAQNPEKTGHRLLLNNPGIFNVNMSLARWDERCLYRFFDSVLSGDKFIELSEKYTVTIATQSSLEKLHSLAEVSQHWTGPISVSVFILREEFLLTELYIAYLRQCFHHVRDQISFHLVYPRDYPPINYSNSIFNYKYSCKAPDAVLSEILKHRNSRTTELKNKMSYPQNHLRNHARRNCKTPNIFLTDVDIIPSIGMADVLDAFLRKSKCEKLCAYVIPVYEMSKNVTFPQNKSEMIKLANNGLARPFHQKIYADGHVATNYSRWEKNTGDVKAAVHVNHNVTRCTNWYEPFYVAHDTVPDYDDRFVGYGFTRNTQVYEMIAAGYQFQVLSPIFACHWGLQTRKEDYSLPRRKQVAMNSGLIRTFKTEVNAQYPNVIKTC